jgi:hypothetical protein
VVLGLKQTGLIACETRNEYSSKGIQENSDSPYTILRLPMTQYKTTKYKQQMKAQQFMREKIIH